MSNCSPNDSSWIFISPQFVSMPMERIMKKTLALFLLLVIFALNACVPQAPATPAPLPTTGAGSPEETQAPTQVPPTEVEQPALWKQYTNSEFGCSFQYPSSWFGPEEYTVDQTLRVEVGSDTVHPYGEPPEQPSAVKNSYNVVIQYTKNNQNTFLDETVESLRGLEDGESLSGPRSMLIRVKQLELGRFTGFEYISTLSDTAQTEPVYSRSAILVDDQSNLITILGNPNNVELSSGADWREVYRSIDEANQGFFHGILDSITCGESSG